MISKEALAFLIGYLTGACVVLAVLVIQRWARRRASLPDLPLPSDPRWAPTRPRCAHPVFARAIWLAAGDAVIADSAESFKLLIGSTDGTNWEGARRYVEAVAAAWRARRVAVN